MVSNNISETVRFVNIDHLRQKNNLNMFIIDKNTDSLFKSINDVDDIGKSKSVGIGSNNNNYLDVMLNSINLVPSDNDDSNGDSNDDNVSNNDSNDDNVSNTSENNCDSNSNSSGDTNDDSKDDSNDDSNDESNDESTYLDQLNTITVTRD